MEQQSALRLLHKEKVNIQSAMTTLADKKSTLEDLNSKVEGDVMRFKEKERIERAKKLLELKVAHLYADKEKRSYEESKQKMQEVQQSYDVKKKEVDSMQKPLNQRRKHQDKIKAEQVDKGKEMRKTEEAVKAKRQAIDDLTDKVKEQGDEKQRIFGQAAEVKSSIDRKKKEQAKYKKKLVDHDTYAKKFSSNPAQRQQEIEDEYNACIKATRQLAKDFDTNSSKQEKVQNDIQETEEQLRKIEQASQRKLQRLNRPMGRDQFKDEYELAIFINKNGPLFIDKVYGPIMNHVQAPEHEAMVEVAIGKDLWRGFVVQNDNDKKVIDKWKTENRKRINIYTTSMDRNKLKTFQHPLNLDSAEGLQMRSAGMTGWLDDVMECPEPVMNVLCAWSGVHSKAVCGADADVNAIFNASKKVTVIVTPTNIFSGKTSKYGRKELSIVSGLVRSPPIGYIFPAPSDERGAGAKQKLEMRFETLQETLQKHVLEADRISRDTGEQQRTKKTLQDEKRRLANMPRERKRLQDGLERLNDEIEKLEKDADTTEAIQRCEENIRKIYKKQVASMIALPALLARQESFSNAKELLSLELAEFSEETIRLEGEISRFKRDLSRLADEKKEMERAADVANRKFKHLCKEAESKRVDGKTVSDLQPEIEEVMRKENVNDFEDADEVDGVISILEARMEQIFNANPNVIREYEKRKKEIQEHAAELQRTQGRFDDKEAELNGQHAEWTNALGPMINALSSSFEENMQNMGHRGKVQLAQNEDYAKWAIEMLVSYRMEGQLQSLDANVQSGGEKSLATVMYLSAMQEHAECPFRVVDEINQGMDEVNERKAFAYVTRSACQRHGRPQCFMISQKVVTELDYPSGITVLFIFNGAYNVCQKELDDHGIGVPLRA